MPGGKNGKKECYLIDHSTVAARSDAQRTRFGETPKYVEGLYDLKNRLYAWMVPNGSWGESNAGLIIGRGEALLVDTLWEVKYTRAMLAAMRPVTDAAPVNYIVNTHADGDHWWGNQLIPQAEIITSQACYDELLSVQPKSMLLLGRLGKLLSAFKAFRRRQGGTLVPGHGGAVRFPGSDPQVTNAHVRR
jgi:glyoxylase-like metal-dependent hydrolase (beta-lactamase superfamily II)